MTVFDVVYYVGSDYRLKRLASSGDFMNLPNFFGNFDSYYQELTKEVYYRQQINHHVIHCLRNQTFYCFFVWDNWGNLHLFNSRTEVSRFLRTQDDFSCVK